jgi:response regulator RpfG family c-di-GMP phosphodiesterase
MTNETATESSLLTLLLLDDEKDILNALRRLLRKEYKLVVFTEGQEALDYLQENTVDMIMSDMRMPNMNGAEFLAKSRDIQEDCIRLLLTGYSDIESTVKAINEGGGYSYIGKPWDNDELKISLAKAADYYQLRKQAKQLSVSLFSANEELADLNKLLESKVTQRTAALEATKNKLSDSLDTQKKLLRDVLEMISSTIEYRTGAGAGHVRRIALQCRAVAVFLEFDVATCKRIYFCALLHEIGKVGLSDELLQHHPLESQSSFDNLAGHPVIGAKIIGRVKRFSSLTENIRHQDENYDGTGAPDHLIAESIPMGARIIRAVKDFDYLIAGKENRLRMSIQDAQNWLLSKVDIWYDKRVLEAFFSILSDRENNPEEMEYSVGLEGLKVGDSLIEDLVLNGNVMLTEGQQVSAAIIEKLLRYETENNTKVTLFIS